MNEYMPTRIRLKQKVLARFDPVHDVIEKNLMVEWQVHVVFWKQVASLSSDKESYDLFVGLDRIS